MTSLTQEYDQYDPMVSFTYGLKSAESRRQYPRRFKVFLDFLNLKGDLSNQAKEFWFTAKDNPRWAEENLMKFITAQNARADTGEISPSTVPNYYKSTKLFCEMNEIKLNICHESFRARKLCQNDSQTSGPEVFLAKMIYKSLASFDQFSSEFT
jgi:hypothetical protein